MGEPTLPEVKGEPIEGMGFVELAEKYIALEVRLNEAIRLLGEAQHYVSHANYDVYLAIQIDEFLAPPKIIKS